MKSTGGGASHSIQLSVLGWKRPNIQACSICRSALTRNPKPETSFLVFPIHLIAYDRAF